MRTLLVALALGLTPAAAAGQSLMPGEEMSSIAVRALADINPVAGTDNRVHFAYELLVNNPSQFFVTIDKVEALNPAGKVVATMAGDALAGMTTRYAGEGNLIAPGQSRIIFMDVSFGQGDALPRALATRVSVTRQSNQDGKPGPWPPAIPFAASATFTGAPVAVGPMARRIAAPLRGPGWIAVNGCCDRITSHRGAVIAIDGKQHAPERFAIDWIQIDKDRRMFSGDGSKLADFPYYGDTIHAVADGTVVNVYDQADEQVPLQPAKGLSPASIGGNMMVVDIGGGAFAFYAHLQRGSLRAKLGDRVKKGQVLGLLGNTGNTDAPHLHFHLMDGPVPLKSNGLPFVIDSFTVEGVLPEQALDPMFDGQPVSLEQKRQGRHIDRLPLNNDVTDFGR